MANNSGFPFLILINTIIIIITATTTTTIIISHAQQDSSSSSSDYYNQCKPFPCGDITFSFPFSSSADFGSGPRDCGLPGYQIACDTSSSSGGGGARLQLPGRLYQVKSLYPSQGLITVADDRLIADLKSGSCESLHNLSIPNPVPDIPSLELPLFGLNLSFFKCDTGIALPQRFIDGTLVTYNCTEGSSLYLSRTAIRNGSQQQQQQQIGPLEIPRGCEFAATPVSSASLLRYGLLVDVNSDRFKKENRIGSGRGEGEGRMVVLEGFGGIMNRSEEERRRVIVDVLSDGFPLQWQNLTECNSCMVTAGGGRCGYDSSSRKVVCFCDGGCDPLIVK